LDGQVAIITGGAGELGRGVCRAMKKAGATVVSVDVDIANAESADRVVEADLTDATACRSVVDDVVREFGGVDTLANLAQKWGKADLLDVTDDEMRLVWETGPAATLRMMQLCHPHMKARGGGAIVNFGSAAGTQGGVKGEGAYAAAKEAIRGLTKHAAVEWGPDNIRVNVVCPVATEHLERFPPTALSRIPLGRMGNPEVDVGGTVVFLAGPTGSFITGRTLHVDGGAGTFR
jgi:NAD(P)-dependent dehydrogenase (short-subunit alcohol dehydrogenase family)